MDRLAGSEPGNLASAEAATSDQTKMDAKYPEAELPARPILSFASFSGWRHACLPSVDEIGLCIWVTSGRIATALGLQNADIGAGDEVLIPAYYCSTMVQAVEAVGATPVFYKSCADLSMDMDDVLRKVTARSKAVVAVHFFGFPQEMPEIQNFCREAKLLLIEDCAHSYFGHYHGKPIGSFGDFAITSVMKFFPISDGGALILPPGSKSEIFLRSGGRGFEAKSIVNNIERSVCFGRLQPLTVILRVALMIKDGIWNCMKRQGFSRRQTQPNFKNEISYGPDSSYGGFGFDSSWIDVKMSGFSRLLTDRLPRRRIVAIRRKHFETLLDAFSEDDRAQPLYKSLPDNVAPYAFPLLIPEVDEVFPVLKRVGIPVLRWEDMDESICPVSTRYSRELLQLPCHQEISNRELKWMIGEIKSALQRIH